MKKKKRKEGEEGEKGVPTIPPQSWNSTNSGEWLPETGDSLRTEQDSGACFPVICSLMEGRNSVQVAALGKSLFNP